MYKALRVLSTLAVAAATFVSTPIAAHGAQSPDLVHAVVAPGSQTDSHAGYYVLRLNPGATITQQIVVSNPNHHAVIADVASVDASTSDATGAVYGTPDSTPVGTGSWISFVTNQLQLAPGERRSLPFTVTVPRNAKPGQYLAAVSVAVPLAKTAASTPPDRRQAGFEVKLQPQRVIAVEVDVPGPRAPHLVVRGVKPVVQGTTLRLQFDVANTGNAFAKGHGTVTVADTKTRQDFKIGTFISHTAIKYAIAWTTDVVPGLHAVTMRLQDQTGRIATWTGTVDVSGSLGKQLQHDLTSAKQLSHKSGTSFAWIAWLVIAICIAAAIHLRRRRAVLRRAPRHEPSSTPTTGRAESDTQEITMSANKIGAGAGRGL